MILFSQTKTSLGITMDEEVREWLKKKMEKVEAGESVLVEPAPDRSKPAHATEKPGKEEERLVEKKTEKEAGVEQETAAKQEIEAKQEPEPEQPVKEQPIKTSVDVGEKIKEHLREREAEREAGAVEKPEEPKVVQQPQAEQELQPEEEPQPEQKQPEQTRPEQKPKSKLFKMPELRLPKISLPKLPAPKRARTASPWMGRLSRRPRFFTKRRILIVIVSSIAGIVAGYLLLQLLSK